MDPRHFIYVYADASGQLLTVVRPSDSAYYQTKPGFHTKQLGQAIREALEPNNNANSLAWTPHSEGVDFYDCRFATYICRENHSTNVGTPEYDWGNAPVIILKEKPADESLGQAVIKQVDYCRKQLEI